METLKSNLIESALSLIKDHGMKQKDIFKIIREAILKEAEHLPKRAVLYNACYGGFSMSDDFLEFLGPRLAGNVRELAAEKICDYGMQIATRFPQTYDIFCTYFKSTISKLCFIANTIQSNQSVLKTIDERLASMDVYLRDSYERTPFEKTIKVNDYCLTSSYNFWWQYKLEDLIAYRKTVDVDKIKKRYSDIIAENESNAGWQTTPQDIRDYIMHELPNCMNQETGERRIKLVSFMSQVVKYGDDPSDDIWRACTQLDTLVLIMISHMKKQSPQMYEFFQAQAASAAQVYEDVGLVAASGAYANLDIIYIPQLVDYEISEYDGKESVRVL